MASIFYSGVPSPCNIVNHSDVVYRGILVQNTEAGKPCFVNSQGLIAQCSAGSAASAVVDGWTTSFGLAGQTATLVREATFDFAPVTAQDYYYLGLTGQLNDAPNGFSTSPIAYKILDRQINENGKNRPRIRAISSY